MKLDHVPAVFVFARMAAERLDSAPLEHADLLTRLTFNWMRPLLALGNTRELETTDLYPLPQSDTAQHVASVFDREWQRQQVAGRTPSLIRVLARGFGRPFMEAAVLKLVHDCTLFVGPIVLSATIHFLEDANAPWWHGLAYVLALFGAALVQSICLRHYFFRCFRTGMNLRTAVTTSVYAKSLRLSLGARARYTSGEVTNLMSLDAMRLQQLTSYLHTVWSGPLQISLALYLLWQQVSSGLWCGVRRNVLRERL